MKRAAARAEVSAIIPLHEEALSATRGDRAGPEFHHVRGKIQNTIRRHDRRRPEIEFHVTAQTPSGKIDRKRIGIRYANIFLGLNASARVCFDGADLDIDEGWLRTWIGGPYVNNAVTREITDTRSEVFVFDTVISGLKG